MTRWAKGVSEDVKRGIIKLAKNRVACLACVFISTAGLVTCRRCGAELANLRHSSRRGISPIFLDERDRMSSFGDQVLVADHEVNCLRRSLKESSNAQ